MLLERRKGMEFGVGVQCVFLSIGIFSGGGREVAVEEEHM